MPVSLNIKNIGKVVEAFGESIGTRPTMRMGVKISGPAAAYALCWEYGRADINPGPKTQWSINFQGENVVLTRTAPHGYIHVNAAEYRRIVREEVGKINWNRVKNIEENLISALDFAAQRCAELIAATAPYDTGDLHDAIEAIGVDESQPSVTESMSIRSRIRRSQKSITAPTKRLRK